MTVAQHYAAARELWIACESIKRLWLLTGTVDGVLRPEGEAMAEIRRVIEMLSNQFDEDYPYERNPYEGLSC